MNDDWASDGEEEAGLGDISAIPEVKISQEASQPSEPIQNSAPPPNAWTAKPSDDVRNAMRPPHQQLRQPSTPGSRQQRRENTANSFSTNNERSSSRPGVGSGHSRPTVLYVTNLPYDASEGSIGAFFETQGVRATNVRITRHSDTGNIKAAFVRIPPEQNKQHALSIDGRLFGSRNIRVKVDGTDGNRRHDRGGSLGSISYGGSFGARERRENSNNGWSGGAWGDRPSASADAADRRIGDSREDRRRESSQPADPTIPTGPPPAGRKKLQLKPRTKPLPVLDVDRRAIDPPRAPASAPPVMGRDGDRPLNIGENGERRMKSSNSENPDKADKSPSAKGHLRSGKQETRENGSDEAWTAARETSAPRQPSTNSSLNKKEDDSKRPLLLNTFAALEVNDSDA